MTLTAMHRHSVVGGILSGAVAMLRAKGRRARWSQMRRWAAARASDPGADRAITIAATRAASDGLTVTNRRRNTPAFAVAASPTSSCSITSAVAACGVVAHFERLLRPGIERFGVEVSGADMREGLKGADLS